jgi:Zn-dependent metalloprotease
MTIRTLPAAWLALGLASVAFGQQPAGPDAGSPQEAPVLPLHQRLDSWNRTQAARWDVFQDRLTGEAAMLYGGRLATGNTPQTDAGWFQLGRQMVERSAELTGLDATSLVPDRVQFLPLAQMGSRDKWTVRYSQSFNGVSVRNAHVNVLFDDDGGLLSVQTTAAVDRPTSALPLVDAQGAFDAAVRAFRAETGLPVTHSGDPQLVYASIDADKSRETRLVWQTQVMWRGQDTTPVGRELLIDARTGRALVSENTVHNFDVSGTVMAYSTPGIAPDSAGNPPQSFPVAHAAVTSAQGSALTDENGNFTIVGATGPLDLSVSLLGSFTTVYNQAGGEISLTQSATGSGNILTLNSSPSETTTAQANAYRGINLLRDWIRSINPTDSTADFQGTANVNLNDTCNAFYDGFSTNYFLAGSDGFGNNCPNTAYSSVVAHEQGHWLNSRYGTNNGSDGMGEGNADVFALYLYDTPINGVDFLNVGQDLRTGLNTLQYCGDGQGGCYGSVHTDGQVWMGAAWKMRARLNVSLGNSAGDLVADSLFLGWLNAYDQTQISSVIETQWLTLDDTDGNIFNGTPHFAEIDGGMRDQGFPGVDIEYFSFQNVTVLGDTLNESGPYVVDATVTHSFGGVISGVGLNYRIDNGPWLQVAMAPTGVDTYQGLIPGQASPSRVSYYLSTSTSPSETGSFPSEGAAAPLSFIVGQRVQAFFDDFESDLGWTHASYGDTSNGQDDWQRGVSAAKAGDATTAFSGSTIWGTDIGQGNWNGAYQSNVHTWLRSPLIDLTDATNTLLTFRRWLTVEDSSFDKARVRINGNVVWTNSAAENTIDTQWQLIELDISNWADGNSAMQIEFELQTDGGLQFGGWCIDDVEVFYVEAADNGCVDPTTYCSTSPNSVGPGAMIDAVGSTSISANNLSLLVGACPANQFGVFFYGPEQDSVPFGQGTLCVGGGSTGLIRLTPAQQTDFLGSATRVLDFTASPFASGPGVVLPGEEWHFQFWYRDPGLGFNLSNAISVTFCP